ncbi:MAG: hypothetical protein FD161_211 [Limisphaerales bacterium]|nr:MAG: hypothetical protein FD161_211 [Limisphaerales bacterium]KAG0510657.1 MAG: hypothetical protein E1N63_211 [Limisphaerales bacterium]TXT52553.1 MAG: hypothetical protein FD140_473 [Limisphaerales bacterium]
MKPKPVVETEEKTRHYLKLVGALLFLIGAGWFLFRSLRGEVREPNLKPFASLGSYAALETAKLLGRAAKILVIYDSNPVGMAGAGKPLGRQAIEVESFKAKLGSSGRFSFAPDWKLPRPAMAVSTVWPKGEFERLLSQQSAETALVIFCDPPALNMTDKARLKARSGRLILVGALMPTAQGLVREGVVHLAVATRVPPRPSEKASESPDEWVARVFARLTPETSRAP